MYNCILEPHKEKPHQADDIVYTSQDYARGCMHKRNRYTVDNSGICVCCWIRDKGGSAYAAHYAKKKGLKIINFAQQPVSNTENLNVTD